MAFENLKELAGTDNVNHPQHYCREDAMECIDEMILIFGEEAVKNFCLCNAWKYRYRAADKNGEEDIRKSDWYIKKYKELSAKNIKLLSSYLKPHAFDDIPFTVGDWPPNPQVTCNASSTSCDNNGQK